MNISQISIKTPYPLTARIAPKKLQFISGSANMPGPPPEAMKMGQAPAGHSEHAFSFTPHFSGVQQRQCCALTVFNGFPLGSDAAMRSR
jgi:hypothetical protein